MTISLPPSLDRDLHTLEEEVVTARSPTPERRLVGVASVCRAAPSVLNMHPKREPLPPSTLAALDRFRVGDGAVCSR